MAGNMLSPLARQCFGHLYGGVNRSFTATCNSNQFRDTLEGIVSDLSYLQDIPNQLNTWCQFLSQNLLASATPQIQTEFFHYDIRITPEANLEGLAGVATLNNQDFYFFRFDRIQIAFYLQLHELMDVVQNIIPAPEKVLKSWLFHFIPPDDQCWEVDRLRFQTDIHFDNDINQKLPFDSYELIKNLFDCPYAGNDRVSLVRTRNQGMNLQCHYQCTTNLMVDIDVYVRNDSNATAPMPRTGINKPLLHIWTGAHLENRSNHPAANQIVLITKIESNGYFTYALANNLVD